MKGPLMITYTSAHNLSNKMLNYQIDGLKDNKRFEI